MPKLTTEDFIAKAKAVHGDKYDYSLTKYINSKTKVRIICRKHGEFEQTPEKHLAGQGCEKCFRKSLSLRYSMGKEIFIEKANAVHKGFYDYAEVKYINSRLSVKIKCPLHGAFMQAPSSHLQGHGCPDCGRIKVEEKKSKWHYDNCFQEAKKYKHKVDFKKAAPHAYSKARENGWLDDYTWLISLRKGKNYWTKEQCYEEAKKYKSKTDFMKSCPTAYSKSLENGWSSAYTWFVNEQLNVFKGRVDSIYAYFFKEYNAIYIGRTLMRRQKDRDREHLYKVDRDAVAKFAREKNCSVPPMVILEDNLTLEEGQEREQFWVEEYRLQGYSILNKAATGKGVSSLGMIGHGKWNRKSCYREALKYHCASEFEKAKGSAYAAALYNGWLKDYTWFEVHWKEKWNKQSCYSEARKYSKRTDFQKGSPSAYNKSRKKGWIEEYDWMISRNKYPFRYWDSYEHCYQEALKYKSRVEFQKGNSSAYKKSYKEGWINDYKWFNEKAKNNYWNKETCYEEAKKYKRATTFYKNAPRAYQLSKDNGWDADYTWFVKPFRWTYEACKAEASKYESRGHFKAGCVGAYNKSRIKGWLDEFFPKKK